MKKLLLIAIITSSILHASDKSSVPIVWNLDPSKYYSYSFGFYKDENMATVLDSLTLRTDKSRIADGVVTAYEETVYIGWTINSAETGLRLRLSFPDHLTGTDGTGTGWSITADNTTPEADGSIVIENPGERGVRKLVVDAGNAFGKPVQEYGAVLTLTVENGG